MPTFDIIICKLNYRCLQSRFLIMSIVNDDSNMKEKGTDFYNIWWKTLTYN